LIPLIASFLCALLIWQLFRFNRDAEVQTSKALWIPTFWLFIAASRNVSAWMQYSSGGGGSGQYLEGSPLDRFVLSAVLALGVVVLLGRGQRIGVLLRSNLPIIFYFFYCGLSILWSDFPDVAFKRWFRACGDVVMVLIVLSDPQWRVALRRLFSRVGFVVVPLSILFIRYFPQMGRSYTVGGTGTWTGVGTDKNALGMICLVFGLASIFRFLQIYQESESAHRTRTLIAQGAIVVMTWYLLYEAHSATALSCYFLAGVPMVLTYLFRWARVPVFVHTMVLGISAVTCSALFFNIGSGMIEELGRNTTLTGRTNIWHFALRMVDNPFFGAGFESFWVGPRLKQIEMLIDQGVNQAHNGYLEVFLNLGWVGVALLGILLWSAYRRIVKDFRWKMQEASLLLGYFIVTINYNFTEAGFKMMHPVWITFLLAAMAIPDIPLLEELRPSGLDNTDDQIQSSDREVTTSAAPAPRQSARRVHREDLLRTR
jgi:exopolysaccharide production protein ExoQ